jgi:hypothetical protein
MGLYDIIKYELECPLTNKSSMNEIQIKLNLDPDMIEFKIGDRLEFAGNMSDLWVREAYSCEFCETLMDKKYPGWRTFSEGGVSYSKEDDCPNGKPELGEYFHNVFINLKNGVISDILSEKDFGIRGLRDFL